MVDWFEKYVVYYYVFVIEILYDMKMEAPISNSKMDICFSNSLDSVKKNLFFKIVLHLLQFVTMAIMIPLDIYVFKNQTEVLSFFIAALITVFISFLAKASHYTC